MKKLLGVFAVAICAIIMSACSSNTAEKVAMNYYDAIEAKDYNAAVAFMGLTNESEKAEEVAALKKKFDNAGIVKFVLKTVSLSESVEGQGFDNAEVCFRGLASEDAESGTEYISTLSVNGDDQWVVNPDFGF